MSYRIFKAENSKPLFDFEKARVHRNGSFVDAVSPLVNDVILITNKDDTQTASYVCVEVRNKFDAYCKLVALDGNKPCPIGD
jgi:hypothetical protein